MGRTDKPKINSYLRGDQREGKRGSQEMKRMTKDRDEISR
jgi:hypothetical protein